MEKKRILFMLVFAVFLLASQIVSAVEIMPVSDIKPGMKGYGLTVYRGAKPERFEVEVLGVSEEWIGVTETPIIIVRLYGGPLDFPAEKTGVVSGMSGSPIYIDGKLLGALAYSFVAFDKDAIAGIQPAGLMLEPYDKIEKKIKGKNAGSIDGKLINNPSYIPLLLSVPYDMAEFLEKEEKFQKDSFLKDNFVIVPSMKSSMLSGNVSADNLKFEPGSSLNVYLVKGDINLAANGTVTMVEGDSVYAFGHPFFGVGEVEMYFHQAQVLTTLSSYYHSRKMPAGDAGKAEGAITDDYYSAIKGALNQVPKMMPVKIKLEGDGGSRKVNFEIFRMPGMTVDVLNWLMIPYIIYSAYPEVASSQGDSQKMTVETVIELKGLSDIKFEDSYDFRLCGTDSKEDLYWAIREYRKFLYQVLSYLDNKNTLSKIKSIRINVFFAEESDKSKSGTAYVKEIQNSSYLVSQGEVADLKLVLSAKNDKKEKQYYKMPLPIPIPEEAMAGSTVKIEVGEGKKIFSEKDIKELSLEKKIEYLGKILDKGLFLRVELEVGAGDGSKKEEAEDGVEIKDWGSNLWENGATTRTKILFFKFPLPSGITDARGESVVYLTVKKKEKIFEETKKNSKETKNKKQPFSILQWLFSIFK